MQTLSKFQCIPTYTVALLTTAKRWRQPKCPQTDTQIKKMWQIYIREYYSVKKGDPGTCYRMDELPGHYVE